MLLVSLGHSRQFGLGTPHILPHHPRTEASTRMVNGLLDCGKDNSGWEHNATLTALKAFSASGFVSHTCDMSAFVLDGKMLTIDLNGPTIRV